jgi:hypothetical protein
MNCANHPEIQASAFCRECGKPMCQECQRPALGSVYCAEHLPVAAEPFMPSPPVSQPYTPPAASPYTAPAPVARPADDLGAHPVLALILGFIPGVGAIYNGQYAKGLIHAVVFGLLVSLASSMRGPFEPLIGLLIGAWVFYMVFEAYHTARKRRYGVSVEEFSSLFDIRPTQGRFPAGAILLIALGFLLLLDTTDIISMDQIERYWPVILIVCGIYMLYVRVSSNAHGPDNGADTNAGHNAVRR